MKQGSRTALASLLLGAAAYGFAYLIHPEGLWPVGIGLLVAAGTFLLAED